MKTLRIIITFIACIFSEIHGTNNRLHTFRDQKKLSIMIPENKLPSIIREIYKNLADLKQPLSLANKN